MELRVALAVGIVVCLGGVVAAASPVAAQEDPRAEAGLDQEVSRNASVLLDASESWSPGGSIAEYDWTVEAPNGSAVGTDCETADCRLANFPALELGTYEVTLTVEDEAGAAASDAMYVEVVPQGPFGVTLTGPANVSAGEPGNLTATVAAGDATLERLEWHRTGRSLGGQNLSGVGGDYVLETEIVPGAVYEAEVTATDNRTVSDTWVAPGGGSWTPSGASGDTYPRIEGPTLITGAPDGTRGDQWQFRGETFELVMTPRGDTGTGYWSTQGATGSPVHSTEHGSTASPNLAPGIATIRVNANIDEYYEDLQRISQANMPADPILRDISQDVTVSHTVVVDPSPQIRDFGARGDDRTIQVGFQAEDQYNPIERIAIYVDGSPVWQSSERTSNIRIYETISAPTGASGQTHISVRAVDGRGQAATASTSINLRPSLSEIANRPSAVLSSSEYSSGGAAPSAPRGLRY